VCFIDEQSFRPTLRDVSTLLKVHRTSITEYRENDLNSLNSPKNSLLFWPSRTPLRQTLLKKHLPWLDTSPNIDLSGTAFNASLHCMYHTDYVRGCTFSPDGILVASASDDKRVRLWDVGTGKLQHVLEGFSDYVYSVVISRSGPHERSLLAAFESSEIRVWELYTGRLIRVVADFADAAQTTEPVEKVGHVVDKVGNKYKRRDERIALRNEDEDGQEDEEANAKESMDHKSRQQFNVASISITQDGKKLAAATGSKVTVWDIPEFNCTQWEDDEISIDLNCVIFSPNDNLLASSSHSQITIWSATTGKVTRRFPTIAYSPFHDITQWSAGHSQNIYGLAFSPDSRFLASGSDDHTARIWDVETGTTMAVLRYHKTYVNSVSFSSDGVYLATGSSDHTICIWKRQASGDWGCVLTLTQPDQILRDHSSMVLSVAFAPKGQMLASSSNDQLRLWDTSANAAGDVRSEINNPQPSHHRGLSSSVLTGAGHTTSVSCLAISPDGEMIASASSDGVICLWDGVKGYRLCTMSEGHKEVVKALVFSQDGARLVSGSSDNSAIVWEDWIRAVAMSPDRSLVATGSDDNTVRVWDISAVEGKTAVKEEEMERRVPCKVLKGHTDWMYSLAFSLNGLHLASASDDDGVLIWDLKEQEDRAAPLKILGNDTGSVRIRGLVFLAGGERLLTVDLAGEISVWNPNDPDQEQCLLEVEDDQICTSLHFHREHPDVLLNERGVWPFELDIAALGRVASSSLRCPRRDMPPPWSPVRTIDGSVWYGGKWIMWNDQKAIFVPREFRQAQVCLVQGHSAVFGCQSGQVLLFRFSKTDTPKEGYNRELEYCSYNRSPKDHEEGKAS
jgi:WD40 repeat protein